MHLGAFGCIRMRSGNFGKIGRKISFFVILGAPGPPPALSRGPKSIGGGGVAKGVAKGVAWI